MAGTLGIATIEVGVRGSEPAEALYRKLGSIEYRRIPGGIVEPWENGRTFDEVWLYLPVADRHRRGRTFG